MATQTQADRLAAILKAKFGENWHVQITLTHRADFLFWLVDLAEEGIRVRERGWKERNGKLSVSEAASIGSWQADLECLVGKIDFVINPTFVPPPKSKRCPAKVHPGKSKKSSRCILQEGHKGPHCSEEAAAAEAACK